MSQSSAPRHLSPIPAAACSALLLALLLCPGPGIDAQPIEQGRGVDSRVDYASLTRFGPWDDRNYQLTLEDLEAFHDDEASLHDPIPAFFRVGLRRHMEQRRAGAKYYPLSALPSYLLSYGGYLVEGQLYRDVEYRDGRFHVSTERPVLSHEEYLAQKFFTGEVRVNVDAAESAIKINPVNPDLVIAGSNGPTGNEMHYSSDCGATWSETSLPLDDTCCDPTVDWNAAGTLAHTATLGNCFFSCDIFYYRSGDAGQTWTDLEDETPGDPRRTVGFGDKEFIHVDRHGASPHVDNVYLSWHDVNIMRIARSSDDGDTWSTVVHNSDPMGIGSDVATDKAGNVYHFYPSLEGEGSSRIVMKKSTDGGATFAAGVTTVAALENEFNFLIPVNDTRGVATIVGVDSDLTDGPFANSLYATWTDTTGPDVSGTPVNNHARVQVAFSRDGGATWTVNNPHPTADSTSVDRFHPWLAVGPDGTVWVAFYETVVGNREELNFVYTRSLDGGVTWQATAPLTTVASPDPGDSFEWGDYNGLDVVGDQLVAIFTDNRNEGGGGGDSIDVYTAGLVTGSSSIFEDGFEAGDTTSWTSTVP